MSSKSESEGVASTSHEVIHDYDCLMTSEQSENHSHNESRVDVPSKHAAKFQETPTLSNHPKQSQPTQPNDQPTTSWINKFGTGRFSGKSSTHTKETSTTAQHFDDTEHSESNHDPSPKVLFCTTTARLVTPKVQSGSIETATVVSANDTTFSGSYKEGDFTIPVAKPMPPEDDTQSHSNFHPRKWRLIALVVSLVLGAVIVGVVIGVTQRPGSSRATPSIARQYSQTPSVSPSSLRAKGTSPSPVMLDLSLSPTIKAGKYASMLPSVIGNSKTFAPTINIAGISPH